MAEKQRVMAMFNRIAKRYDLLNHVLSFGIDRRWRAKATREVGEQAARVLDVACGTGDFSLALLRRGAREVVGMDISENMLEVARVKARKRGVPEERVTFLAGDAEATGLPGASFDAVTVAFGVRNFERLERSVREFYRVLRPGGRLVILEFAVPRRFPVRGVYRFYFTRVLPFVGGLISGDRAAYSYLPASVYAFPSGERFLAILRAGGFVSPVARSLTFGIVVLYSARKPAREEGASD
ncbi:MAG: bifunctional demethylmenaquinone methyltransferase/2-methoxy-6-polyprenyl-1,4-benzoquinol methylase UbiE [Odoribacteraceae bacterium]|jgi:demethylmenaquinone methyltransferase/2-methoxy-6-polyprenyl-1,4-benzoquinol methylase|nr:bifunctional demethylmenaquinone methyltransferase/2-methoxy-6-polyprenyl-1,4-benzoquinol methylase UbiE [Odoribacteraceae bacterium]